LLSASHLSFSSTEIRQAKEDASSVSLEQMLDALMNLGLSKADAQVYLFLAPKIPQKASDMANALKMKTQQLYPCLRKLQEKGIVKCTNDRPKLFSAVPIESVLDLLVRANLEEAQKMELNRQEILSFWQAMIKKNSTSSTKP
jgi:sugar-specific transcriptional regulator TrmB